MFAASIMKSNTIKKAEISSQIIKNFKSEILNRYVTFEIILPPDFNENTKKTYPFLILNDGQDNEAVKIKEALIHFFNHNLETSFITIGIHAGERLQEYGVAGKPDFKKRGSKADLYTHFLMKELLPVLGKTFRCDLYSKKNVIAGYSLGGLSAIDIAWNNDHIFSKAAAFSGSFWWRKKALDKGYKDETDRILLSEIKKSKLKPNLRFWFQAGTQDEKSDRNNNGIIDAIDDTLDLITILAQKGYRPYDDVVYYQIEQGEHIPETWAHAMPEFLNWAFSTK